MNKHDFRKHIAYSFAFQVLFIISVYMIISFLKIDFENKQSLGFYLAACLITVGVLWFIYDPKKYRARLNDIYPDSKFGLQWYVATILFPLFFIALTIFLCVKDHDPKVRSSVGFKTVGFALIPMVCLQIFSPMFSYYLASPSVYFIFESMHATARVMNYKAQLKNSDNVVQNYVKQYGHPEKSSEKILLLAASATSIIKEKEKISPGSKNLSVSVKYGDRLIESVIDIYYLSEKDFSVLSYSPIQWVHPSGAFEILLLEGLEKAIMTQFHKSAIEKNFEMMATIEKGIGRLPASEQEMYKEKFKKHRQAIELSKAYKDVMNR